MIKISEANLPIRYDAKGDEVRAMQQAILDIHNAYGGIIPDELVENFVDGAFGPNTEAALGLAQATVKGLNAAGAEIANFGVYDENTHIAFNETITMLEAYNLAREDIYTETEIRTAEVESDSLEAEPFTHTVEKNNTLGTIAEQYDGVSWQDIYNANRELIGDNPDIIHPGMELVIPGQSIKQDIDVHEAVDAVISQLSIGTASESKPREVENGVVLYSVPLATPFEMVDISDDAAVTAQAAPTLKKPVFSLDVGHGNILSKDKDGDGNLDVLHDRGAPTADASLAQHEREVLLELAPYISRSLEKAGFDVAVVGDHGNHEVAPNKYDFRIDAAHENEAVMHATLHADGHIDSRVNGARYYSHEAVGKNSISANWAANLTEADEHARVSPQQTRTSLIQPAAFKSEHGDHRSISQGLKDIPGVLIEAGFVSNKEDLMRLTTEAGRQQIADAIAEGTVKTYEHMREQDPTLPALQPEGAARDMVASRDTGNSRG